MLAHGTLAVILWNTHIKKVVSAAAPVLSFRVVGGSAQNSVSRSALGREPSKGSSISESSRDRSAQGSNQELAEKPIAMETREMGNLDKRVVSEGSSAKLGGSDSNSAGSDLAGSGLSSNEDRNPSQLLEIRKRIEAQLEYPALTQRKNLEEKSS